MIVISYNYTSNYTTLVDIYQNRFITFNRNSSEKDVNMDDPKVMVGIMFDALISLIDVLEDELMTDFKLDHLYELIVEQSGKLNKLYL